MLRADWRADARAADSDAVSAAARRVVPFDHPHTRSSPQPTPAPTPNPLCNCAANMTRALESACTQSGNAFRARAPINYDCGQCLDPNGPFRCRNDGAYCGLNPSTDCVMQTMAPTVKR